MKLNNNSHIFFTLIIMFGVSFSIFFAFMSIFGAEVEKTKSQEEFYLNKFSNEKPKILFLGNSQIASVNATIIEQQLLKNNKDYSIINLAIAADRPQSRLMSVDEIISLKPQMIIYGIGFFEFENIKQPLFDKPESFLPDPQRIMNDLITQNSNLNLNIDSPKLVTLNLLRNVISEESVDEELYYDPSAPFFGYDLIKKNQIRNNIDFESQGKQKFFYGIKASNENPDVKALKNIIKKFQENNIHVILLISPFNKHYIDNMPYYYEEELKIILDEIKSETNVEVYSLLHKYKELNIWSDLNHISINSSIKIFNADVAEILLKELD